MKKFLVIALMSLGLLSCSSCAKKNPPTEVNHPAPAPTVSATVTQPPPAPVDPRVTVSADHWSVTLPDNSWTRINPDETGDDTAVLVNSSLMNMIIVEQKDFPGTLDVFALVNIRALRNSGAQLVSAKQVEIDGHKFVLVEASKGNNKAWMWMAVEGGHGFGLTCGGPAEANHEQLCAGIAATLKLK